MKILMLHDCAHVGYELNKHLKKMGVTVEHIQYFNKHGASHQKILSLVKMFEKAAFTNADLIHAHYLGSASHIARLSGKPYIVHVHGSDVRGKKLSIMQKSDLKNAKAILYATLELKKFLPENAVYLPTPIGLQFHKHICWTTYLTASRFKQDVDFIIKNIPYSEMPIVLSRIKMFYDQTEIPALSKTALEALACGCTVVRWDGKILTKFPCEHKASNVANRLLKIYKNALK